MLANIPVAGSPLIPTDFLTFLFLAFLVVLGLVYFSLWHQNREAPVRAHLKTVSRVGLALIIFFLAGTVSLAVFWFLPTPVLVRSQVLSQDVVPLTKPLVFQFDRPVSRQRLEKMITPEVPGVWVFEASLYRTHLMRRVVFYPQVSFKPNTEYTVQFSGLTNVSGFSRTDTQTFKFQTRALPEFASFSIKEGAQGVAIDTPITVNLTDADEGLTEFNFRFHPQAEYKATLSADKRSYVINFLKPLDKRRAYLLEVEKSNLTRDLETQEVVERSAPQLVGSLHFATSGEISAEEDFNRNHPIYGDVRVIEVLPANGTTGVKVSSKVSLTFSQAVNHQSAQSHFSISPSVEGSFEWGGDIMTFVPSKNLPASTKFTVTVSPGVSAVVGRASSETFVTTFTTASQVTKLGVPIYLQKHALSCEAASLRMALAYKGKMVTEATLLSQIGVDSTAHNGTIWGDPQEKFVGNVDGRQMVDGYGVHWLPIARVASEYGRAESFEGWSIDKLTEQINNGNPVIIWVFSNKGISTTWYTPSGKVINAVRDEHTVVVSGYVGDPGNPTQLIVNDPLIGQVYWSRSWFDKKWNIFNRSGVVVY